MVIGILAQVYEITVATAGITKTSKVQAQNEAETDDVHPQVLNGVSRAVAMDEGQRADKGEADEQHRLLQALALEWMYEEKIPRPEYS
nr:hypothetical protein [Tanacetum cinerariifolium]